MFKRFGILLVLYLLQCLVGTLVELELYDVDEVLRLDEHIHPSVCGMALHLGIKELVNVQGQLLTADEEPQVIERSKLVVVEVFLTGILFSHHGQSLQ